MIGQEQYDGLNEGDTITGRFLDPYTDEGFEVTGKVYVLDGMKCLAGWNLQPKVWGKYWTIIEHIPGTPAWHSAQVISAVNPKGERLIHVRSPRHEGLWVNARGWYERTEDLEDVKILVDKDAEL